MGEMNLVGLPYSLRDAEGLQGPFAADHKPFSRAVVAVGVKCVHRLVRAPVFPP